VRLTAGTLALDGQIVANGSAGTFLGAFSPFSAGAGSGGGIYVSVTTLQGGGSIQAAGASSDHEGGGGGRVAVYAADWSHFDLTKIQAVGGSTGGNGNPPGGAGTVYLKQTGAAHGTLIVNAAGGGSGTTPLSLPGATVYTFIDSVIIEGSGTHATAVRALVFQQGLTIQNAASLQIPGTLTVAAGGQMIVSNSPPQTVQVASLINDGTLEVQSDFTEKGDLSNSGAIILAAGNTLNVQGNFTQSPSATLDFQIGGTPASNQFGHMNVSGTAAFDGILRIDDINSYDPTQGDRYQVMTYASSSGQFGSIRGYAGRMHLFDAAVTTAAIVVNAVANGADLAVTGITVPQNGIAGQDAAISYTVQNLAATSTSVSTWFDSVYLSPNPVFDASDLLVARVKHTSVIDGNGTYTVTLTDPLPGVVPGQYYVIVIADSGGLVPDVNRVNNALASSMPIAVTMPTISAPGTISGSIATGQDVFYQVQLTAGSLVQITASFDTAGGGQLYERYQNVPGASAYDQLAFDPSQAQEQIAVNGTEAGNYYLWLHGLATGSHAYTITVQPLAFAVTSISPTRGSNSGSVTVTVHGSQFSTKTTVSLGSGGSTLPATQVFFQDDGTLYATFDLTKLSPGAYALQIQDPSQNKGHPVADPGAFTVNNSVAGSLSFSLTCSQYTNDNKPGTITIDYTNTGNTDVPAPLMILSADTNVSFVLPEETAPIPGSVQLLGINQTGPAGILPPGCHGTAELSFLAGSLGSHQVTHFTLSTIPSASNPFDWSSVKNDLRPASVRADAWDVIYPNFITTVGTTLGQYQQALDDAATYLSQLGESTFDVSRYLSFILQKADDFGAISQRYALGAFGRGWPDPTNIQAVTDPAGNVTIEYSGRVRSFFKQADGSYQGVPGDAATLSVQNGAYQLRETDGTLTAFNPDGTLNYTQETNGNRITAGYTGGRLTSFLDSLGNTVSFTYNSHGRIGQVKDAVGRITTYLYDPNGDHLLSVTDETGTTTYAYVTPKGPAQAHALQSITYPDGTHVFFSYDDQGRLLSQSRDGDAEKLTYSYDSEGGISVTDATGGQSTYYLNEFEQVAEFVDPLGQLTRFRYDANHNLTQETGPDGITTTITTDSRGNPTGQVDPLGHRLDATYDPVLNRLQSLRDSKGNTTRFRNDANGNLQAIVYPDGSQEQFKYDPNGFLTDSTNRRGQAIHYVVSNGLVTHEDFADGTHADFTYDAHRNLTSATDSSGTVALEYKDPTNPDLLTKVTYPSGRFLQFTYTNGRRTQMVDQGGFTVVYHYDAVGRLDSLKDGSGTLIVSYHYDPSGRLDRKVMGNGTSTTYQYDAAGNLLHLVNYAPDNSVISRFDYLYDHFGRPTSVTTLTGTTTYRYDTTGQLTSVSLPGDHAITYQYDANGNRMAVTDNGVATNYTTNDLNQYTTVGNTKYTYDADGNLVSQTDSTGTTSYSYNDLGQLVGVVSPKGTWSYQYDALGDRIAVTQPGRKTQYLIDPTGLGDVVGEYDGNGNLVAHYTQGLGLTSRVDAMGAAYYNFDLTGNTTELTDGKGGVLNTYSYLLFGEIASATGTTPNPFTYVGQFSVMSDGSGQYFMRNRWYDAVTGRFTQPDPIGLLGGDANTYRYADNGPVAMIDPKGLSSVRVPGLLLDPWANVKVFTNRPVEEATAWAKTKVFVTGPAQQLEQETLRKTLEILDWGVTAKDTYDAWTNTEPVTPGEAAKTLFTGALDVAIDLGTGSPRKAAWDAGTAIGHAARAVPGVDSGTQYAFWYWFFQPPTPPSPFDGRFSPDESRAIDDLDQSLSPLGRFILNRDSVHLVNGDPNSLTGPASFGTSHFISGTQTLPYTIAFTNEHDADIPVQQLVVTEQLDPNLDWTTFQVSDFNISGTTYHVPANSGSYSTRLDLTTTLGIYLDVTAGINLTTGVVTWTFTSIDPKTGDLPSDIFTGFLPPDKTPPQGEAFVTYTIRPKAALAPATAINALVCRQSSIDG
jgi:RHS repeat-associated protein